MLTRKLSSVSVTLWSPVCILQTLRAHHVPCLASARASSQPGAGKRQQTAAHQPPEDSWRFSLQHPVKSSSATKCKADQCVHIIKKSIIACPFTCSCVCFGEMFLHRLALALHTWVHFNETLLRVFAPAKQHPTHPTFQRTLSSHFRQQSSALCWASGPALLQD